MLFLLVMLACKPDPCDALCVSVARRLDGCRAEWGATWEDLGAKSKADMQRTCKDDLAIDRGGWPARQIPEADAECDGASADLSAASCDELRALYLP